MSGPRVAFTAETARSAVEQAEWGVKKWVWVPDVREGYVAGYVHSEDEDSADVVLDSGRQVSTSFNHVQVSSYLEFYSYGEYDLRSYSR